MSEPRTIPSRPRDRLFAAVTLVLAVLLLPAAFVRRPGRARELACRWALRLRFPAENLTGLTDGALAAFTAARTEALWRHRQLIGLTSGYREPLIQQRMFDEEVRRSGSPAAARMLVLPPTESNHVKGIALDVRPHEAARWLEEHGARYDLYRIYDNEWWHFEYRPECGGTPPRQRPHPGAGYAWCRPDHGSGARQDQRLAPQPSTTITNRENALVDDGVWDRRSLLRGAAALAGAAATAPLLGGAAPALAGGGDADALFKAGKFEQAGRAYEEILKKDPKNLLAARRRGYVGLLSNRFPDAEKYLKMALKLAPDDKETNQLLGDCYIRQDKFALSAPHWKAAGEENYAKWFAAVRGEAYQVHGETARVPLQQMDPMPLVEASVNGGPTKRFTFYTGAPNLSVRASVAKEAGLRPVASQKADFGGGTVLAYWGILDSFQLGGIELRNIPVSWSATVSGEDVGTDSDGLIGMWVFYHLLPTFDYAGRQLILRRRTPETARKARAAATRAGAEPLPLWLAREQYLHSTGSFAGAAGSRTGVVGVNFGGVGEIAAGVRGRTAEQLGIRTDYDRQIGTSAQSHPAVVYPCYPKEIHLGNAVAKEVYCYTNPNQPVNVPWPYGTGFDSMGWFSHCFWKPYNITVDFTGMNLYIARGKAT